MSKIRSLITFASILITSSCSNFDKGTTARSWDNSMAQLGVFTLFPLDSELRVGDILTTKLCDIEDFNKNKNIIMPVSLRLTSISKEIDPIIARYYKDRMLYPHPERFSNLNPQINDQNKNINSLRFLQPVSYPAINLISVSGSGISALLNSTGVSAKFSGEFKSDDQASISIDNATAYNVPLDDIVDLAMKAINSAITSSNEVYLLEPTSTTSKKSRECENQYIATVVTKVFFAENATITLTSSSALAISGNASPAGLPVSPTNTIQKNNTINEKDSDYNKLLEQVNNLKDENTELSNSIASAQGKFHIETGKRSTLSLTKKLTSLDAPYGMAFGYKGFRVLIRDGVVVKNPSNSTRKILDNPPTPLSAPINIKL